MKGLLPLCVTFMIIINHHTHAHTVTHVTLCPPFPTFFSLPPPYPSSTFSVRAFKHTPPPPLFLVFSIPVATSLSSSFFFVLYTMFRSLYRGKSFIYLSFRGRHLLTRENKFVFVCALFPFNLRTSFLFSWALCFLKCLLNAHISMPAFVLGAKVVFTDSNFHAQ